MILLPALCLLLQTSDASVISSEGLQAAERGLRYLEQTQLKDGSWAGDVGYKLQEGYRVWNKNNSHIGVTALAGMAFLAGGNVPGRGPRGQVVERLIAPIDQAKKEGADFIVYPELTLTTFLPR